MKEISPSILPKLAECALYEGSEIGDKTAVNRGTNIDIAIRQVVWECQFDPIVNLEKKAHQALKKILGDEPSEEDCASVIWGAQELMRLADGEIVETREEFLAMGVPQLSKMGTADAACWAKKWVSDIKTGQARNYREQLAAYSLACMRDNFEENWTAHVIYVDQKITRTYCFSQDEAEKMLDRILYKATNAETKPTPCEYCSWCKHYNHCGAIVRQAESALALIPETTGNTLEKIRERILSNQTSLGAFLRDWKLAEKELAEPLQEEARARLERGETIEGWKLISVNGRKYVDAEAITKASEKIDKSTIILAMGGKMTEKSYLEFCAKNGVESDKTAIKVGAPTTQLRQTTKK